jgi:hypothetical protein
MATTALYSKNHIVSALRESYEQIAATVTGLSAENLTHKSGDSWSAAEYLQHLNLSVKSIGRATQLPPQKLVSLFGKPDHESHTYDALVALYLRGLERGIRAEDAPKFMPTLPEDQTHLRENLLATWADVNTQLWEGLANWSESQLDEYCIGHPLGPLTIREMMFFTIYHNQHHLRDIQTAAGS